MILWQWIFRDAYAAHIGERWWSVAAALETRIREKPAETTDEDYSDLIASAEAAFAWEPNNVIYGYWLSTYRWESMSRAMDLGNTQIALHPDTIPFVSRIADELAALRRMCPTYGPPYALEGQLRLFVLKESQGAQLIEKGVRLAPYDPPTCLVAGELAARQGNLDAAQTLLVRAVSLNSDYFLEVANLYIKELKRPDLARALANTDHNRLSQLANLMANVPEFANEVPDLRAEAEAALGHRADEGKATPQELATLAGIDLKRGKADAAIKLYRMALGQDYQQLEWRLSLAGALAKNNQIDEAIHEVKIVLRLRPRHSGATKLLEDLTSQSENARTRDKR
jgi:tetratricopeptide (TPR) repeat protein